MLPEMARIRIVDAWLRHPAGAPIQQRAIMVVAEAWAEQRVLMRAYASSPDQTLPTIVLHGTHLAIGPAGVDAHGPWGIHVQPPADGRAQRLREELEVAARRLAGSKGNPPRLMDEESAFERRHTGHWAPGTPPNLPAGAGRQPYYEPSPHQPGPPPGSPAPASTGLPGAAGHPQASWPGPAAPPAPAPAPAAPGWHAGPWHAPVPRAAPNAPTVHLGAPGAGVRPAPAPGRAATAVGLARGAGAQLGAGPRPGGARGPVAPRAGARRLASLIRRTMPIGFHLTGEELAVLDALDAAPSLTATRVAELVGTGDAVAWMQRLMAKLAGYGIDLIEATPGPGGELVYALRR